MAEYNIKRKYEHGSLDEITGEVKLNEKRQRTTHSLSEYAAVAIWSGFSFVMGIAGESVIHQNALSNYHITVPFGTFMAAYIPLAFLSDKEAVKKEAAKFTALASTVGIAAAFYLNL